MVDADKVVQEQTENLKDMPEEQRENAVDMMTAFGNFMNCIWKNNERKDDGQNKRTFEICSENQPDND